MTPQAKRSVRIAWMGAALSILLGGLSLWAESVDTTQEPVGDSVAAEAATLGALGGRRHRKQSQTAASQQSSQQNQAVQTATAEQIENLKKAFVVCLEAKDDYIVEF